MRKIIGLFLLLCTSILMSGMVFADEGRQEVTLYESYDDSVEEVLVSADTKVVKSVPHDLGDVQIDRRGRINIGSIRKYSFDGIQSLCSLAVKLFLQEVTGLRPYQGVTDNQQRLWKGDAIRLIESGKKKELLQEIPTQYRELRRFLTKMRQENRAHSMIDVFIHTENKKALYESEVWYLQGHRIVIFLGSDAHWYVYDPFVLPYTTKPHTLKKYLESDLWRNGIPYTLYHGYAPENYEHHSAQYTDGSMQTWLDDTIDTIHENTLGEIEDYADSVTSLFDVMKRPVPPLI